MKIAAIDQGTTSTRLLLVKSGGETELVGQIRHQTFHPGANLVEQDPLELLGNIRQLLARAGQVDAIGLANQGESCLAWDARDGRPLSPVLVWQDARTSSALAALGAKGEALSKRLSGLPLDPYFSASKLAWLLQNLPEVASAAKAGHLRLGTTDAFFLRHLTGRDCTDLTTASRTGLLDLATLRWSPELCALHGVPIDCLPKIVTDPEGFGAIDGIPVLASVVDQQAALVGHGCDAPGTCKITFGTGAFLLAVAGQTRPETGGLLPTIAWVQEGSPVFAIEGGIYDAGAAIEWARRAEMFSDHAELSGFDLPTAISRGLAFVPAISGLAAPHWDRSAAPLLIGMGPQTTKRDMLQALVEGVALLTAMMARSAGKLRRISIDGGLSQSDYFAQILASATGAEVVRLGSTEMTSIGLAALCGQSVGAAQQVAQSFAPGPEVSPADLAQFARAVELCKGWRSQPAA